MPDLEFLKERVEAIVDVHADRLVEASHALHARPELAYEEHHAHDVLSSVLEDSGMDVQRSARGLATAFEARAGSSGPVVALLCEYDALPGIGHACGHNIIGAAGIGAGIAAAAVAEEAGGTVVVLGTPGEEGGGGKILLAEAGAFTEVDAALMIHPASADLPRMDVIAIQHINVTYEGRAAHAAAAPHLGRNALDAAVLGYMNVAALRQHMADGERVHGIFTDGGEAPNVVPERAATSWYVRSPTVAGLLALKDRVLACLEAGATAAGCRFHHESVGRAYADMVDNDPLIDLYAANLARTGRRVAAAEPATRVMGSTDMGNISHIVPSIHPMIAVAPTGTAIHTQDFATCAVGADGDRAVVDGAKAMATTVVDLWAAPGAMARVRGAFEEARSTGRATGRAGVDDVVA